MSENVMTPAGTTAGFQTDAALARLRRRKAADTRLRFYGLGAIIIALLLLATLVTSLVMTGHTAFLQTHITYPVFLDADELDPDDPYGSNYRGVVRESFFALFPEVESLADRRKLSEILSNGAPYILRDEVSSDPELIGQTIEFTVPAADPFDQFVKGSILRDTVEEDRRITDQQIVWMDRLEAEGRVSTPFNWGLFVNADSRFPELAGLSGAITGSFFALLVCFLISFPTGIAAAVYLEEFAPKNKFTDLIEVNINNLAAVPSVVFGLLGLAVFLGFFGLPRSAPLVGGMTLALMTLPTIIITTRASLKAVPPSIREAALGIGASKHQVMMHHVVPLAMPGILTGTIIGLAQALGETAPLLLIGMNAFITSAPGGITDPATALPTQIFIWADSPERGFVSRTSAAILVLLGFLVLMNAVAIYLRRKFERRW
ncbi:phosphate ABC transporter permease PstA [Tepidicaulis sp. LMO-SS28]|uniref:phosphate ABC transporter permease PstA n=1 Tax=Tepidicaulis sp. LMO-SS28 TaxID=3447455 RepID=UPI003EDFA47C